MNVENLANLIRDNRERLLADWKERVTSLRSASDLDAPALLDHLPDFMLELSESLRSGSGDEIQEALEHGCAPAHGLQRLKDGFDIEEVVAEYNILRGCIHDFAEKNGITLSGRLFHRLNRALDAAVGAAVRTYSSRQALEVLRRREEYLAFVIHDLRTPLSAISMAAALLDKFEVGKDDPRIIKLVDTLMRNTKHLEGLISKVLEENSHLLTGSGIELERRNFELWPMVEALLHELHPVAGAVTTTLVNQVPHDLIVNADAGLLSRIFQNLIGNAIAYTPAGKVTVGARALDGDRGGVECWVSDTGEGIPESHRSRIFEVCETDAREGRNGSGLGLAIVRTFVESHGGKVAVESEAGDGSTFRFTLGPH